MPHDDNLSALDRTRSAMLAELAAVLESNRVSHKDKSAEVESTLSAVRQIAALAGVVDA